MLPAQQGLHLGDHRVLLLEADLGLVEEAKLFALYGAPEVVREAQALEDPLVHGGVEHLVAGGGDGTRLRLVHGRVGVPEQILGALPTGAAQGDPDADRQEQFSPVHRQGFSEGPYDPLGYPHRILGVLHVLEQHYELVPAEPGEGVLWP